MSNVKILVVDDDRGTCAILSKTISELGYEVDVAYDAPAALQLVADNDYKVAVLDFKMPGMNGVELYETITKTRPAVVGIMLTGLATINTVFPAIGAGMERVFAKPVDFKEFIPVIQAAVAGRQLAH